MRWAIAVLAVGVSACSSAPSPVAPVQPLAPAPVIATLPSAPEDTCGAAQFQALVGRSRTEVPVAVRPEHHRVTCATCPAPDDEDSSRLNFLFDAETGRISAVRCG